MASRRDNKFGAFGGVFTPSVLTILGVIMYLRLPSLVGFAGLGQTLAIIAAAHVISVSTGLSISSIATDKNVGAGGPYYIVSRSLGLPIGGTLGLALFLGLSFSISLYIIGFSESFLAQIGLDPQDPAAIRVCGTVTLILLTIVTFISTSFAIKTQYVILGAIVISLVAIFFGSPAHPTETALIGAPDLGDTEAPSLFVLFGVFFPAVTGFTAGVNMSGDLRDAKSAIPKGTLAAIGVGLVVYVALAIFLAFRVRPDELRDNPRVLEDLALWAPLVTAGIWGATLSSALGSILGAPRILQTISGDGITHRWFAKGYGATKEPRNALLLAFAIGEIGVLIAELDAIAEIVSMVFMTTYAFLNIACAIEAWVSPDFRPDFRIPKMVSVVGAIACIVLMLKLNPGAMAGATTMMALLFFFLQRRQLQLESGDAWEGIWSTLVRAGLHRLSGAARQQRNWRPNILMFRPDDGDPREGLHQTANTLITGTGMLTDVILRSGAARRPGKTSDAAIDAGPVVGVFTRTVDTDDAHHTVAAFAEFHGYAGVEPNTILLDWQAFSADGPRFEALIERLREQDLNTLLFSDRSAALTRATSAARIDVWWRVGDSPALGIALVRFITNSETYRRASVRFCTVCRQTSNQDAVRTSTRRMLEAARVNADVEVLLDTVQPRPVEDHIVEHSADARLAIVELPAGRLGSALQALTRVTEAVPSVLYISGSSAFASTRRTLRAPARDGDTERDPQAEPGRDAPPLEVPAPAALARFAEAYALDLEVSLDQYFQESLARVATRNVRLINATHALVDRHFKMLLSGITEQNPVKRRRHANRVQSAFLHESHKLIDAFVDQDLRDQRDTLEGRARALLEDDSLVDPSLVLSVERPVEDFDPDESDARDVAKFKKRQRSTASDGVVRYELPTEPLARWAASGERIELAHDATDAYVRECWVLATQLLKVFNASRTSLAVIHGVGDADDEALGAFLETDRAATLSRIKTLREQHEAALTQLRHELATDARALAQEVADGLDRVDLPLRLPPEYALAKNLDERAVEFVEAAERLHLYQRALFERAQVGLKVSAFQHRLATIVERTRESIAIELRTGILASYQSLEAELESYLEAGLQVPLDLRLERGPAFDPQRVIDSLALDARRSAEELPETVHTLEDSAIQRLADGDAAGARWVDLPLRRLAQFLVDAELVGPLTEVLADAPALEARAIGVAEDVCRLVGFHLRELRPEETPESLREQMRPVAENALARLRSEVAPLELMSRSIEQTLQRQLNAVLKGTDVFELTSSAGALGRQERRHQGQRAVSGAQSALLRGVQRARETLVSAIYGRSASLLMARRLRAAPAASTAPERLSRFTRRQRPDDDALRDLPFYYRQLFLGKNSVGEALWVERDDEVSAARDAIRLHERGAQGMIIVTGEPDSGKTALCRRLLVRTLTGRPSFWISPPDRGAPTLPRFHQALREATGKDGASRDVVASLPARSVVVIEDLERWWERADGGLAVVDQLLSLVAAFGSNVLFVVEVSAPAFELINQLRRLADRALAVVRCGPVPAAVLRDIVMLRHGSTGMTFDLDGVDEADLSGWRLARLFSRHFDASGGLIGAGLLSWIANVQSASERSLVVRGPTRPSADALNALRPEWVAILIQLLLHKRLDRPRLARISQLSPAALDAQLDVLLRTHLVHESGQGILRIDRFMVRPIVEHLRAREVIP